MKRFQESLRDVTFLNKNSKRECKEILDSKMKPVGSLGVLEEIAEQLAGILPYSIGKIKRKGCHIVAVSDNGIIEENISPCPPEYTRLVAEEMLNGIAPIGIFCKNLDVDLKVIDVGMKKSIPRKYPNFFISKVVNGTKNFRKEPAMTKNLDVDLKVIDVGMKKSIPRKYPNFFISKVVNGTKNFRKEPAMTINQVIDTIENGIFTVEELEDEYDVFSTGEMGIGNTTTSSAVLYSLTRCGLDEAVGRGAGVNDEGLALKKKIIFESCVRYNTFQMSPTEILASVGGLDIAFMVGLYIGAAKCRKLILVDGFISAVAALVASRLNPIIKNYLLFTHISEEPGMKLILKELGKEAFLNMKMRLGEGTGAIFAYPMVWGAVDIYEAFMVGLYIGAAKCRKLILVDGFISAVAALVASRLNPIIKNYLLFTHISEEPGMKLILKELGKEAFLNMKMRLGEGTGAIFAYPMIWGAVDIYEKMKTPREVYNLFFEE